MKKTAILMTALTAASAHAAPVFNIFELGIKDGQSAAYNHIGDENIRTSLANEPGTLAMYSVKQKANPQMAYMIEIYADDAAYQTHIQSPQYQKFREASPQILTNHKHKYNIEPQYLGDKKVEQSKNTRTHFVSVTVKPEANEPFAKIVKAEMSESIAKENGVRVIYAATDKAQPNKWYFFEIYDDDAAYQSHRDSPHFQKYLKETAGLLQDKTFTEITPTLLQNQGGLEYRTP